MIPIRPSRKSDPFLVLLLIVVVGMSATIVYQLRLQDTGDILSIRNAQNISPFLRKPDPVLGIAHPSLDFGAR